jgi:aryl carrier-like protein
MTQDEMKALLKNAWLEVFQVSDVTDDTDFFEAGGDSILAVQLSVLLVQKGVKLDLADVFTGSTFGKIAEKLTETAPIHIPESMLAGGISSASQVPEQFASEWKGSVDFKSVANGADVTEQEEDEGIDEALVGVHSAEEALAIVLEGVIPNFDRQEDFFAQGLTSLDVAKIVARCKKAGYPLELKDVYINSTFDELLEVMKK